MRNEIIIQIVQTAKSQRSSWVQQGSRTANPAHPGSKSYPYQSGGKLIKTTMPDKSLVYNLS